MLALSELIDALKTSHFIYTANSLS